MHASSQTHFYPFSVYQSQNKWPNLLSEVVPKLKFDLAFTYYTIRVRGSPPPFYPTHASQTDFTYTWVCHTKVVPSTPNVFLSFFRVKRKM